MPAKSRPGTTPDTDDTDPTWDTTPITMRHWALALPEYLEDIDATFVTWWSHGYVQVKTCVCAP